MKLGLLSSIALTTRADSLPTDALSPAHDITPRGKTDVGNVYFSSLDKFVGSLNPGCTTFGTDDEDDIKASITSFAEEGWKCSFFK
jgi:hypothetical protein